jgi:hypothetical protein
MATKQKNGRWLWCLAIFMMLLACGLVPGQMMDAITSEPVYIEPVALAKANSEVIEALGEPIADHIQSFEENSQYEIEDGLGFANLDIVLTGRYAVGVLRVEATLTDGVWSYQVREVRLGDGRVIQLLGE